MRPRPQLAVLLALALASAPASALAAEQGGFTFSDELAAAGTASAPWWRHAGSDRYETSAAIVADGFDRSEWVVVSSGANFADALSATALAGVRHCPLVLAPYGTVTDEVAAQIARIGATRAYVVGGEGSLSSAIEADLEDLGLTCTRISGLDRQQTSVEVADEVLAHSGADVVFVASGMSYPDALSAGPWAWGHGAPILLASGGGTLTQEELDLIHDTPQIARVVLLGGEASVSEAVAGQLAEAGLDLATERIGGTDRYDTSRLVALWEVAHGLSWSTPTVASGRAFPDALAGAAFAGSKGSVLLLADDEDDPTITALRRQSDEFEGGHILGGQGSVAWTTCVEGLIEEPCALVDYVNLSPNNSGLRTHAIDTFTPHYMDNEGSVEWAGELFAFYNREASSNYGIGPDGRIGLYVEECKRSWCSASVSNDQRAVTIECANLPDTSLPEATWDALVELMCDVCVRHGIDHLDFTGDATGTLTMHKYFAVNPVTECPGPWFSARFADLAAQVNARLGWET